MSDKLNLTNAARAQFDVVTQTTTAHFTADHGFHAAQGLNRTEVDITAENKRTQHLAQLLILRIHLAAHHARFDHRVAFPIPSLFLVIVFECRIAHHQRATFTERTQTHVHAVTEAIKGLLVECFNDALTQTGKELRVGNAAARTLGLTVFWISENQVDIRREVQLTATKLAHADDQHSLRFTFRIGWRAPLVAANLVLPLVSFEDHRLSQLRQMTERLF